MTKKQEEREGVAEAKELLRAYGYVVVKGSSYRRAQEKQRTAETLLKAAEERIEDAYTWARNCLAEERRLVARITHVYAVALEHGATLEELRGPACPE